jgi:hypothetical protein
LLALHSTIEIAERTIERVLGAVAVPGHGSVTEYIASGTALSGAICCSASAGAFATAARCRARRCRSRCTGAAFTTCSVAAAIARDLTVPLLRAAALLIASRATTAGVGSAADLRPTGLGATGL